MVTNLNSIPCSEGVWSVMHAVYVTGMYFAIQRHQNNYVVVWQTDTI